MMNQKMNAMNDEMDELKLELTVRLEDIQVKEQKDVANYGVPLGNAGLVKRRDATLNKISRLEIRIEKHKLFLEKKYALPKHDSRVLRAIRQNQKGMPTETVSNYKFNNDVSGSGTSRRHAKEHTRRGNL